MDVLRFLWGGFLILTWTSESSSSNICNAIDRQKCACFFGSTTEISCPRDDPMLVLTVRENNQITLQCHKLNGYAYIDLDMVPDVDLSDTKIIRIDYCYLNTSFINILDKMNIRDLKTLIFESVANNDVDLNITISKETFDSLENLTSLKMSYNTVSFAPDFLANTPDLLALTLSKNSMSDLRNYFSYVPKLKVLDLTGNQIISLPDGIFQDLHNLTRLMLFNNNLTNVSRNAFFGLEKVQLLELSINQIEGLSEDTFADLRNLVNVSLRGNKIRRIYKNTFANNPLLENIRLGSNKGVILSDYVFANLTFLRTLELSDNGLEEIPENIFQGCDSLEKVILSNNLLITLESNIFRPLKKLRVLNLSRNRLRILPDELFSSLNRMEELILDNNQLTTINMNLFAGLNNLKKLDVRKNSISHIDLLAFTNLDDLVYLDLSFNKWNNSVKFKGYNGNDLSPLGNLKNIEDLNLSHNEITGVIETIAFTNLKSLDLSFNKIHYLEVGKFAHFAIFPTNINLEHNEIEQLDFEYAEAGAQYNIKSNDNSEGNKFTLRLAQNPVACNCSNYDLIRFNNNQMKGLNSFVDIVQNDLYCSDRTDARVLNMTLNDVDCPVDEGCPAPCKCWYKPYHTAVIVDCSSKNLTSYPVLNVSTGLHRYNQTFLILSGNGLSEGPSVNEGYSNVTRLDLSKNFISHIDWLPPHLKHLNLNNNVLLNLNVQIIGKLNASTSLEQLNLKNNSWKCGCESLEFQNYLMQHYKKVDSADVYCDNTKKLLVKMTDLCKVSPYLSVTLPVVLALFLCFAILFALFYRYKTEIKVYLFAKNLFMWFVSEEELDKDKIYDVFVSYAHEDESFVVDHLLPELEKGERPYKVCIHIRDWIPGEFIAQQVVNSVQNSRRTLVVLSNSFVDSVWGKLEFRTAHTQTISEGRTRVIVVVLGDLDESKLDDELKSYLKTNTYVKWGDKYFWNKLKYALPHSKGNFYENNKKHNKVMLKIDDKFDLIKSPPSPSNTSTPPITLNPSLLENKNFAEGLIKKIEGEAPLLEQRV